MAEYKHCYKKCRYRISGSIGSFQCDKYQIGLKVDDGGIVAFTNCTELKQEDLPNV